MYWPLTPPVVPLFRRFPLGPLLLPASLLSSQHCLAHRIFGRFRPNWTRAYGSERSKTNTQLQLAHFTSALSPPPVSFDIMIDGSKASSSRYFII